MIRDLAVFAARQAIGQSMAAHGAQKLFGWFEGPGPEKAAGMMHGLGFRPGTTYAALASWNETIGGELVALGLGGPIGPAMLISTMIVAQASVHWPNGYFTQKGGIELGVIYSAGALVLAATDYGAISADRMFGWQEKFRHPVFTTVVLAAGIASAVIVLRGRQTAPETPATPTYRGTNSPSPETDDATPAA